VAEQIAQLFVTDNQLGRAGRHKRVRAEAFGSRGFDALSVRLFVGASPMVYAGMRDASSPTAAGRLVRLGHISHKGNTLDKGAGDVTLRSFAN